MAALWTSRQEDRGRAFGERALLADVLGGDGGMRNRRPVLARLEEKLGCAFTYELLRRLAAAEGAPPEAGGCA